MDQAKIVILLAGIASIATGLRSAAHGGTQVVGGKLVIVSKAGLLANADGLDLCFTALTEQLFGNEPEATNGTD